MKTVGTAAAVPFIFVADRDTVLLLFCRSSVSSDLPEYNSILPMTKIDIGASI